MQEKSPVLSIIVLLVIIAMVIGVLFLVFKPGDDDTDNTDNVVSVTKTVTPTQVSDNDIDTDTVVVTTTKPSPTATNNDTVAPVSGATPPENWQAIDFDCLGYTAYRPSGFFFRMFPPDCFVLGLDTNRIPEASEYMGMISLMKLSGSNNFTKYIDQLEDGYTKYTRSIDDRTWTIVEGKQPANELFDAKFVKLGNFKVGSKEYMARIESTSSNFGGYADEFEIFITTLKFD